MARSASPDDATISDDDGGIGEPEANALPSTGDERYEVVGEIGRGGLGVILRAVDRRLGRTVALKVTTRTDDIALARFRDEARITAALEHPGIVPVHDVGEMPGDVPFFAMRLSGGRSLADAIDGAPDLAARLGLLGAVLAIADAMAYAHSRGVIHRDLKPANVLVGEFGETLVIDWGLAKRVDAEGDVAPLDVGIGGDLTIAGDVLGTPAFMSPEQARGEPVDYRADVYAIGSILYNVLTGERPRRGDRAAIIEEARHRSLVPVDQREPGVPRDLAAICARALALDPAARYPTARELAEDLRRFQTGQLVAARDYTLGQRLARWIRRRGALVAMAAVSLVVLAVVGGLSVARVVAARRQAEEQSARLMLDQARSALDRDPAVALAWLRRLLASPGVGVVDLEQVRVIIADARARGVARHAIAGAGDLTDLIGTPDGRVVVGRTPGGEVTIWDLDAGRLRASVEGIVRAVAMAPDGRTLATADERGVVLRDLDGRERARVLDGRAVSSLAYASDGGLIIGTETGHVHTADGRELAIGARVIGLAALADGAIAIAIRDAVLTWDPATAATARVTVAAPPLQLAAAPDGVTIGAIVAASVIVFRRTPAGLELIEENPCCGRLAFGPDGRWAHASRDRLVIRDPRTGFALELSHPENGYVGFAGRRLLATNMTRRLYVFDELPPQPTHRWQRESAIRFIRALADGRIAFFTVRGEIGVVDPWNGTVTTVANDPRHYGGEGVFLFAANERLVFGGTPQVAELRTGETTLLPGHARGLACVARVGSEEVAVVLPEGNIQIYDASFTALRGERRAPVQVADCAARADGTLVLTYGGAVMLVDPSTGTALAHEEREGATIAAVGILPDGTIVFGDFEGEVRAWRPGAPSRLLYRHEGPVWGVAVSPDGTLIASSSRDRTIRIARPDGSIVQVLRGHTDEVSSVVFAPAGDAVFSSSMDATILRWPLALDREPPRTRAALAAHVAELTSVEIE